MKSEIKSVVFLSNYFNHHQKPFSEAMHSIIGDGYLFVETTKMPKERIDLGWGISQYPSYVVSSEKFIENKKYYKNMINNADVVIIGSAPNELVKERIRNNKLVFRYAERPLKKGLELKKYIPRLIKWHIMNPPNKNIYMLCASAYTADDYAKFGLFKKKCYKWGYFTETKRYDNIDKLIESKKPASILWVARFIECKHPEVPVEIAKRLKSDGYHFELSMIGNGILEGIIKNLIVKENLEDYVRMLGAMKHEEVRAYMEQSEIFLFTSDRREGWGAVLNESMNSACAVVANREIGSVPYIIKDGENGYVYQDKDINDLYFKVKYLLDNSNARKRIARNAYETIESEWNAKNAADKFVCLAENIIKGEKTQIFENGVCSLSD
jgi:glycosyltransferase involved in cell wall biosynthesis